MEGNQRDIEFLHERVIGFPSKRIPGRETEHERTHEKKKENSVALRRNSESGNTGARLEGDVTEMVSGSR